MEETRMFVVRTNGNIEGLWADNLAPAAQEAAEISVRRVSQVEYNHELRGWQIRFLHEFAPLNDYYSEKIFRNRKDALAAETSSINNFLLTRRE